MIQVINENCTQSTIDWSVTQLIRFASVYSSVLDIGCGDGRTIKRVQANKRYGIDVCTKALRKAKANSNGVVFLHKNLLDVIYGEESLPKVECVIGIDILEHFFDKDAFQLIEKCEQSASKCLMFFIPVGNHPQSRDDRGFGNHYYQTHRSKWFPEYMDYLGYDVWFYPYWHKNILPPKDKGAMWCRKIL